MNAPKKRPSKFLWLLLIIPALILAGRIWAASSPSAAKGSENDSLAGCPDSPNCVSSESSSESSNVARFKILGEPKDILTQCAQLIEQELNAKTLQTNPNYFHAVVSSPVFGFKDDIELLLLTDSGEIQVRSASRTGYSDMGKNRKRVEKLREILRNDELIH